jgi:hypothetical protein
VTGSVSTGKAKELKKTCIIVGRKRPLYCLRECSSKSYHDSSGSCEFVKYWPKLHAAKRFIVVRELAEKLTKLLLKASKKKYYYDNDEQVPVSTLFLRFHDTWSYLFQVLLQIRLAVA